MKQFFKTLSVVLALAAGSINAETSLITQSQFGVGGESGNWRAQAFKLSDSGFKSQGSPITSSLVNLSSLTLIKGGFAANGDETSPGQLSLVIMTSPLSLNSVQSVSSNKIDIKSVAPNEPMKFTFDNKAQLLTNQKYWIRVVKDNGNGSIGPEDAFTLFRAKVGANTIAGEIWGKSSNELQPGADAAFDLDLKFEFNQLVKETGFNARGNNSVVEDRLDSIVSVGGVTLGLKKR